MLVCNICSSNIPQGAKFCAQCGDPVTDEDRQKVAATIVPQVVLSFGESSSSNYSKALDICKNIPSFETEQSGKKKLHKLTLPLTEVELIANIFDLVGSWKSSNMLINGSPATKKDLTYFGIGCYRTRQKSYVPKQYCFGERAFEANIWGCKRLNMPVHEWGGGWLDYGRFDNKGVWHFDKEKIRHQLNIAIKEVELCPVLDKARIFQTLEALPDSINPKTDGAWQYKSEYKEIGGNYKEVAVGIRPVIKSVQGYILGDFKPAWQEDPQTTSHTTHTVEIKLTTKPKSSWKKWVACIAVALFLLYLVS